MKSPTEISAEKQRNKALLAALLDCSGNKLELQKDSKEGDWLWCSDSNMSLIPSEIIEALAKRGYTLVRT